MSHLDNCICSGVSRIHAGWGQGEGSALEISTSVQILYYLLKLWSYGKGSDKIESRIENKLQMHPDFINFSDFSIFSLILVTNWKRGGNLNSGYRSKYTNFDYLVEKETSYDIWKLSRMPPISWYNSEAKFVLVSSLKNQPLNLVTHWSNIGHWWKFLSLIHVGIQSRIVAYQSCVTAFSDWTKHDEQSPPPPVESIVMLESLSLG